jgi:hypothetical protein
VDTASPWTASAALTSSGNTYSRDFPSTAIASGGDHGDAFLAVVNETGQQLVFAVTVGGRDGYDSARVVLFDKTGRLFWGGTTKAASFATSPEALQREYGGGADYGGRFRHRSEHQRRG